MSHDVIIYVCVTTNQLPVWHTFSTHTHTHTHIHKDLVVDYMMSCDVIVLPPISFLFGTHTHTHTQLDLLDAKSRIPLPYPYEMVFRLQKGRERH